MQGCVLLRTIAASMLALLPGCITGSAPTVDTTAVTDVDPATATVQYWVDQPATVEVSANDYDRLWNACDHVSNALLFSIDRTDYRDGVMTTKPLISKYFAEFWRRDVTFSEDLAQSSIATYRRTIRYELHRTDDGRFTADVKVIVERSSSFERRVTTAIQYRDAFAGFPPGTEFYADDGSVQPQQTWYAVGRDHAMEEVIGDKLRAALK
jgi:hypothetical protein